MRICYIAPLTPGPEHTQRWIRYFADAGYEVHVISSDEKISIANIENVPVWRLRRFGPRTRILNYLVNSLSLLIQFKRLIRKMNPDIIHAHSIVDISLLGAFSGFHPFVVTPWGSEILIEPKKSKVSRWIVKYVLKRADLITCDAEHIQEPLVQLGADPPKINLIYFGVDIRKFRLGQREGKLSEELGIIDSPTIASFRRLDPDCDVASLITAIPLVLREVPKAKFIIAGKGSEEANLEELAKSLGVSDSISFLGWISNDELPRYLASADVYVSTALSDAGIAASTAEAMACGLPVIITDFGDNRKWVKDGENGYIIPPKAPETLASRIIYLLQNEDTRRRFGQLNRQVIEERNNWEKEMGKMGKLYENLLRSKR